MELMTKAIGNMNIYNSNNYGCPCSLNLNLHQQTILPCRFGLKNSSNVFPGGVKKPAKKW